MKPEERARQMIDDLLAKTGWVVQDLDRMNLDASLGVAVREFPLPSGAADYLLFIDYEPVGIVEAKKIGHALIGVEEQSAKYLTHLPPTLETQRSKLPFSYESNSIETRFTNHLDPEPRSRQVFAFHRPEILQEWLSQAPFDVPNEQNETLRARLLRMPVLPQADLRECQVEAITNLEQSLALNKRRALIQMATGSGKTYTSVSEIYRLIKFAGAKRVVFLETKEARRECLAREVTHAVKNKPPTYKIGSWQGVPIFVTIKYLAENPYTLAIADPYMGIELSCHPLWFEEGNQWRIDNKLEEFFRSLAEKIAAERTWISNHLQKADEFEVQATTIFPQHDPWQVALARKGELDRYIDAAVSAQSQEDFQRLAQMRHHLLETAPKELMERPKPKNTATFVLPPRNPNAQDEAVSTTQIEVTETKTQEQTIEEMARTIQQSVVGSRAAVSFGDLEQIAKNKKTTKGKRAPAQPQSQPKTDPANKQATKGEHASTQQHPQPKTSPTKKKATQTVQHMRWVKQHVPTSRPLRAWLTCRNRWGIANFLPRESGRSNLKKRCVFCTSRIRLGMWNN